MENVCKNLLFGDAEVNVFIIWMRTLMDDPIHVQIEIVKFWDLEKK